MTGARPQADQALVNHARCAVDGPSGFDPSRGCIGCGAKITRMSKSGRCKKCARAVNRLDPEFERRRVEGIRRHIATPEGRAKKAAVARHNGRKASLDPEYMAKFLEGGRRFRERLNTDPAAMAQYVAACRMGHVKRAEKILGWCPDQYRAEYRKLIRHGRMTAANARKHMEQKIADARAATEADSAADFLRHCCAVSRTDSGTYRVGFADLTRGELLLRAEAKGYTKWKPAPAIAGETGTDGTAKTGPARRVSTRAEGIAPPPPGGRNA